MSEVSDAIQVVIVSGRAMYTAGRLSVKAASSVIKMLNTIYLAKWKGKASLGRLRQIKGDDLAFLNVTTEETKALAAIEKEMKAHGILYARMPDLCGGDGRTQYAIGISDVSKIKPMLLDHTQGDWKDISVGLISEKDYLQTGVRSDGSPTEEYGALMGEAAGEMNRGAGRTRDRNTNARQTGKPDKTATAAAAHLEGNPDLIRMHELRCLGKEDDYFLLAGKPILHGDGFEIYPMPGGTTGVVIGEHPGMGIAGKSAVIFADREYKTVDFETCGIGKMRGEAVISIMKTEDIFERNAALKARVKEKKADIVKAVSRVADKKGLVK